MLFQEKVVIVTGAGKGIGKEIAISYAEQGAKVVIADKTKQDVEETVQLLTECEKECLGITVDVRAPEAIKSLVQETVQKYGAIDILINNAGISFWKSPYDITLEEWDSVIHTNLRGTFLCSREVAKVMRQHGGGAIVNISSTRALMSEPDSEAYAASKGGILSLTHALAVSLGPDRITVNAISPGWIETGDYERLREIDHAQHPSGRVGRPEDIARACLYLTNPQNEFITGVNLVVDGGMTRKMIYEE